MKQFANVVEWEEWDDTIIFSKWYNREIKKGSTLILRPGQNAIFLNQGKVEGVFQDPGEYDMQSQIIPFLSTLKGFKFGFNSGMRCEVLFINTKELLVNWGTKSPVNIRAEGCPGGIPIRAFGTFTIAISDYLYLIEKVVGIKAIYRVDELRDRVVAALDSLLLKWISQEGSDMFNLQANAMQIAEGIRQDLDMKLTLEGITVTNFTITSFNYPEEIQSMITKNASHSMIGNMNTYTQVAMADGMARGGAGSEIPAMMYGMNMANQQINQMNAQPQQQPQQQVSGAKFCPECGTPNPGAKFCPECGGRL